MFGLTGRRPPALAWRVAAGALLAAVLLPGCGIIDGMLETEQALTDAGFEGANVTFESTNGFELVVVKYPSRAGVEDVHDETLRVAEVVWDTAPLRLDAIEVVAERPSATGGVTPIRYGRAELETKLGPRGVDEQSLGELLGGRRLVAILGAVGLLGIAVVAMVVVLIVRSSGRRRAQRAQGWQGPGWQQGAGWQQPPPPGPWGRQPPPPAPQPTGAPADPSDPWGAPPA